MLEWEGGTRRERGRGNGPVALNRRAKYQQELTVIISHDDCHKDTYRAEQMRRHRRRRSRRRSLSRFTSPAVML